MENKIDRESSEEFFNDEAHALERLNGFIKNVKKKEEEDVKNLHQITSITCQCCRQFIR